jgi:hypothetical protein
MPPAARSSLGSPAFRHQVAFWIAIATAAAFTPFALGAVLGLTAGRAGAGDVAILTCDSAFGHGFTTSRGNVTSVTVSGIADPTCEAGVVRVTVKDAAGASIASAGPQAVPTDGDVADNSITLATSPQPSAPQVAGVDIVIEGP